MSGGASGGRRLVLEATDGNRFAAFRAATDIVNAPGLVILPDVRGLHPFYEELALRFSEAGVYALALDYYGRTASGDPQRIGIPISGDDKESKRIAAELIDQIGFDAVDAGTLAEGGRKHQPGSPVYAEDLRAEELRARLCRLTAAASRRRRW